jgi:shikimate dehydrogenase
MDQYGVMGNPIHHSLSPAVHRLFAEETRQTLSYQAILVQPGNLARAIADFAAKKGNGLNITAPFKMEAYTLVDDVTERAARAKAVNTIRFNSDGARSGDNTDGAGLVSDLVFNQKVKIEGQSILLLGAGGAVRGVLNDLLEKNPACIVIANRTFQKAATLVDEFAHDERLKAHDLADLKHLSFDLVINGTTPDNTTWPSFSLTSSGCCYDMRYANDLTPFLEHGLQLGASICRDGLGMLIEQAAESFYFWRGIRPDTKNVLSSLRILK